MSAAHTPGPWRVSPVACLSTSGRSALYRLDNLEAELREVERAREYGGGGLRQVWPEKEYPANARLIAAAPEMLGALQWIETYARVQVERHPDAEDAPGWSRILAAIAKATGQ